MNHMLVMYPTSSDRYRNAMAQSVSRVQTKEALDSCQIQYVHVKLVRLAVLSLNESCSAGLYNSESDKGHTAAKKTAVGRNGTF
jgi:hypothetical protein